jgi:hypothetical protein
MANARNTDFTLLDFTEEINLYPKVWSLISGMNMFDTHNINTTIAQVERVQEKLADIASRKRGGERNFIASENAITENFNVPFFPLDRSITAGDVQNFREYGSGNTAKSVMGEVDRVMTRVRSSQAQLKEKAMALAIQGIGLEGAGIGVDYNYYTKFGITQSLAPVDFTDLVTDPSSVIEALGRRVIVKAAQDGTDSHASYQIAAICGEDWFSAFIAHPEVEEAYKYFESKQDPLRKRLGMTSEDDSVRVFKHKGVTYIEDLSGNFPALEAHILPMNMPQMFRTYVSPADDLEYANTAGQELYLWYKADSFNRQYKVESECSFLCVNTRPELVIKSVATV